MRGPEGVLGCSSSGDPVGEQRKRGAKLQLSAVSSTGPFLFGQNCLSLFNAWRSRLSIQIRGEFIGRSRATRGAFTPLWACFSAGHSRGGRDVGGKPGRQIPRRQRQTAVSVELHPDVVPKLALGPLFQLARRRVGSSSPPQLRPLFRSTLRYRGYGADMKRKF